MKPRLVLLIIFNNKNALVTTYTYPHHGLPGPCIIIDVVAPGVMMFLSLQDNDNEREDELVTTTLLLLAGSSMCCVFIILFLLRDHDHGPCPFFS
jgi:hypothetical protein